MNELKDYLNKFIELINETKPDNISIRKVFPRDSTIITGVEVIDKKNKDVLRIELINPDEEEWEMFYE